MISKITDKTRRPREWCGVACCQVGILFSRSRSRYGCKRWERDVLGDLDLSIGVVYVGERHLLTSIKKVGLIS
jgi:hypothetical protein